MNLGVNMAIATRVKQYLDSHGVEYNLIPHPRTVTVEQAADAAFVPLRELARAVVLKDKTGYLLAVLPADHHLDFGVLHQQFRRELALADDTEVAELFKDCEQTAVPPLGDVYGLETVVDDTIAACDDIYFAAGSHAALVHVGREQFQLLQSNSWHARFSRPNADLAGGNDEELERLADAAIERQKSGRPAAELTHVLPISDIKGRLEKIEKLPAMPEIAQRIVQLSADPYTDARDVAEVVELDPSLAAQIVHYARSPFFGYQGSVNTIQDAIARVLGFDMVMNIALGIVAGRSFRNQPDGPLGLKAFWHHAVYSAALAQALGNAMPTAHRPRPGTAYLAGLLHNFGVLLLGHFFPAEFFLLNKLARSNPDLPIRTLEKRVVGMDHPGMGALLMRSWDMPEPVIAAIRNHHDEAYSGEHQTYVQLVLLADRLLKRHGIGDAETAELPEGVLGSLGLTEERVQTVLDRILGGADALDSLARQIAA